MRTDVPDFSAGSYHSGEDAESLPRTVRSLSADCLALRQLWIDICRRFLTEWSTHKMPSQWKPGVRWDGGRDTAGRTYSSIWPKFLKLLDDNSLRPKTFIIAQFYANRVIRREPFPNLVVGPAGIQNYRAYCGDMSTKCKQEVQLQTQVLESEAYKKHVAGHEQRDAYQLILYDENLALSALFRYCVGVRMQLDEVCAFWRRQVLAQYMMCPDDYDRDWSDCIPKELQEASRNRQVVAGKVGKK